MNKRFNESKIENIPVFFQTCGRLNIYKRIWEIYVVFDYTPDWSPYVYAKSTG